MSITFIENQKTPDSCGIAIDASPPTSATPRAKPTSPPRIPPIVMQRSPLPNR